jgi:hypothetical protein
MIAALTHATTVLAYVFHVGAGALALVSGMIAVFARKGGHLHRSAGNVFFYSMLVMGAFACFLGVVVPDQVNVFIGAFVLYLVATARLTVSRKEGTSGISERIALLVALVLLAPFAILAFQLATGASPLFKSTVPFNGPVLIALYGFTAVLAIAAISDAKVVLAGGIRGAPRIERHLWRMCLGLTLATGSAFTNGFSRFLPGPHHVPPLFFLPQFLPLGLLIFWMIRVRFTGWFRQGAPVLSGQPSISAPPSTS